MKTLLLLGQTIEKHRKALFDQGYSYDDADEMVQLAFEEKGMRNSNLFVISVQDAKEMIAHLNEFFNA